MKKLLLTTLLLFQIQTFPLHAQCLNCSGIDLPAIDLSVGYNNYKLVKIEVNTIITGNVVFGLSGQFKTKEICERYPIKNSINAFIGYYFANCVIFGANLGMTESRKLYYDYFGKNPKMGNFSDINIGLGIKLVASDIPLPVSIGGYYSNDGVIGLSVGTIISYKKRKR